MLSLPLETGPDNAMNERSNAIARNLTLKYALTLGLLAGLALANYLILKSQITASRLVAEVVDLSGRQRALLQRSALLAQELALVEGAGRRKKLRGQLLSTVEPMAHTHHALIRKDSAVPAPQSVRQIYFDSPWLLDTEMRNFVAQFRTLVEIPDAELGPDNPHVRYLREAAAGRRLTEALDAVVSAYQREAAAKTDRLEGLAVWSLGSTVAVLAISGWFVFRPMVRRVKSDMVALAQLNDTLERRVSERSALAEQRAEALLQSERLAAIGQMVAGVAHESRNALQQIQACCGMLGWKLDGGEAAGLVRDVERAQQRLERLFDDLRGYAAPLKLEASRCDVREVFAEAWRALECQRDGRDVALRQESLAGDTRCMLDPLRLEQVFRNILDNALAACSDPAVIGVRFAEAALDGKEMLEITIRDNGPGLSEEERQKIFQPFYSTKSRGSGLGMAITRRIVEAHGGRITVANPGDRGTEILMAIPRGQR
jgi:signal transduction histidine kinase